MNEKDSIIDQHDIKEKLRLIINPVKHVEKPEKTTSKSNIVLNYYKWYIDFYANSISPNTGKVLSKGTVKTYKMDLDI